MGTFFDRLARQSTDAQSCFLCGALDGARLTLEHVIPQWAQRRFNLWNESITLLNGTAIRYRSLTIPCCLECNNLKLKPLEDVMSEAVRGGVAAVREVPPVTVFLWLAKLVYGLLHRELFLPVNRMDTGAGPIVVPDFIRQFEMVHRFLQATRSSIDISNVPTSVLVIETQVPMIPSAQWDFRDSPLTLFVAVRMGPVAIIASLMDGGAQAPLMADVDAQLPQPLHPMQYLELAAQACYTSTLATRTPTYAMSDGPDAVRAFQMPLGGLSGKPIFDDWNESEYARLLSAYTEVPFEVIYQPPNVMTWLRDANGVRRISLAESPWPPG